MAQLGWSKKVGGRPGPRRNFSAMAEPSEANSSATAPVMTRSAQSEDHPPGRRGESASSSVKMERKESSGHLQEKAYHRAIALATVAHELKTPLVIVSGYIDLLLGEKVGSLNDRQRQILRDAGESCERLQKFVRDFLAFSALDSGRIAVRAQVGDLNECLSRLCGYWVDRFTAKGVALYFSPSPDLKPFEFDAPKVEQIVSNLLENAFKFTPTGGTVWMTAEPYMWERRGAQGLSLVEERRRAHASGTNAVKVTVADTGCGIAPEYHQEVFDDFFKVPEESHHAGATGLGLAIVRRLVSAHGGKVWVESERRQGSKFCFLLPLSSKQENTVPMSRRRTR
jgi:signal transduction histidine kinase